MAEPVSSYDSFECVPSFGGSPNHQVEEPRGDDQGRNQRSHLRVSEALQAELARDIGPEARKDMPEVVTLAQARDEEIDGIPSLCRGECIGFEAVFIEERGDGVTEGIFRERPKIGQVDFSVRGLRMETYEIRVLENGSELEGDLRFSMGAHRVSNFENSIRHSRVAHEAEKGAEDF